MRRRPNILRDVFFLSLPVAVTLAYLVVATAVTLYNGEILGFHGVLVGRLRVGSLKAALANSAAPLLWPSEERVYLGDQPDPAEPPHRVLDLRVERATLDAMESELIASAKVWRRAGLVENGKAIPVEVCYRGQTLSAFFWTQKSWRIRTLRENLVDGYEVLSLSPLSQRMSPYLGFLAAKEAGLDASRVRLVRLYVNRKDQGLYVQEEQIDESLIRRLGFPPGDVFHGELFTPEDPRAASNEVFWNPHLWTKRGRDAKDSDDDRPALVEFADDVCDPSPASFERLRRISDVDRFALWLAVLSYFGDQHADLHHNHKLYFDPVSGKFEPMLWDPLLQMSSGDGVEPTASRLTAKLTRDPDFLDSVQRLVDERLYRPDVFAHLLQEIERIEKAYAPIPLNHKRGLLAELGRIRARVEARRATVRRLAGVAEVRYRTEPSGTGTALIVDARSLASLRLSALELLDDAAGVRLFEDRDGDGRVGPRDRELPLLAEGRRALVARRDALVHVGRDFSARYRLSADDDPAAVRSTVWSDRDYTRLAYLESRYLLLSAAGRPAPRVGTVLLERTVGDGPIDVRKGSPEGLVATESIHPWTLPASPPPRRLRFAGFVVLRDDLEVGEDDLVEVAPGTRFRLGPGVSLVFRTRVHLVGVRVERLDPGMPWGVIAVQGPGAAGSVLEGCRFEGGSEDTLRYVRYDAMVSIFDADRVSLRRSHVGANVRGVGVRFAQARDLRIEGVTIDHAMGDGIEFDLASGVVADVAIIDPGRDGLVLRASRMDLRRVRVCGAGDVGITASDRSTVLASDCEVSGSPTGITIEDEADATIRGVRIHGCGSGVEAIRNDWRFGAGGKGRLVDGDLSGNDWDVRLDSASTLALERCRTERRFLLPADRPPNAFLDLAARRDGAAR